MGNKRKRKERRERHRQWVNRKINLALPRTVENMQELLRDVTWQSFRKSSTQRKANVTFRARAGSHMGRPVIVIMGHRQFVAVRAVKLGEVWSWRWTVGFEGLPLNPSVKRSGIPLEKINFILNDWGKGEYVIPKQGESDEGNTNTD